MDILNVIILLCIMILVCCVFGQINAALVSSCTDVFKKKLILYQNQILLGSHDFLVGLGLHSQKKKNIY